MQYFESITSLDLNFTLFSWHCWIQGRRKEKTQQNQKYCLFFSFFLILCLHYPKQNSITTISNLLISHHFVADSWLLIGIPESGCVDITIICESVVFICSFQLLDSEMYTPHFALSLLQITRFYWYSTFPGCHIHCLSAPCFQPNFSITWGSLSDFVQPTPDALKDFRHLFDRLLWRIPLETDLSTGWSVDIKYLPIYWAWHL